MPYCFNNDLVIISNEEKQKSKDNKNRPHAYENNAQSP